LVIYSVDDITTDAIRYDILLYLNRTSLPVVYSRDAKADKLRRFALNICRIAAWKCVCSKCDKIYLPRVRERNWVRCNYKALFNA
jgi:hypothetical protein